MIISFFNLFNDFFCRFFWRSEIAHILMDIKFSEIYFKIIPPLTIHIISRFHIFISKNIFVLKPMLKIRIACMEARKKVKSISNNIKMFHFNNPQSKSKT